MRWSRIFCSWLEPGVCHDVASSIHGLTSRTFVMTKLILALVLSASGAAMGQGRAGPPPPTPAPEPPPLVSLAGGKWGVVGALTAPMNANVVEGGLGWPGVHASYLRGLSNQLEMG